MNTAADVTGAVGILFHRLHWKARMDTDPDVTDGVGILFLELRRQRPVSALLSRRVIRVPNDFAIAPRVIHLLAEGVDELPVHRGLPFLSLHGHRECAAYRGKVGTTVNLGELNRECGDLWIGFQEGTCGFLPFDDRLIRREEGDVVGAQRQQCIPVAVQTSLNPWLHRGPDRGHVLFGNGRGGGGDDRLLER